MKWIRVMSFCVLTAFAGALCGQQPADPPSRVARLNYLDGPVSFRPGNLEEWAAATLNYPLTNGDRLWTDQDSGAELHIGATSLHMAELTAFGVLDLSGRVVQMSLAQGTVYLRIPRMEDGQSYEMDTPSGAIAMRQTGDYRFGVSEDGTSTLVTVRAGEAEVAGAGHHFTVHPGQTLRLLGTDEVAVDVVAADPPDPWEQWCLGRDRLSEQASEVSDSYVPPEMTGSEDLSQYGDWSTDAAYGAVWTPRGVGGNWAPYRFGHWANVPPWGWTWIDDAKWGFAPFHYGRWASRPAGWVWVPGPRSVRPVYAPAVVAFIGSRGLGGASATGGRLVAWVPLGPREPFHPVYRASDAYVRRLNGDLADKPVAPAGTYANGAYATAVSQTVFVGARQVSSGAVRLPAGAAGAASLTLGNVRPGRASYLGRPVEPGVSPVMPPPAVVSRRVVGRDGRVPPVQTSTPAVARAPVGAPRAPAGNGASNHRAPVTNDGPPASDRTVSTSPQSAATVAPAGQEQQRQAAQQAERQRAQQQQAEQQRAHQQQAEQQRAQQHQAEQQRAQQQQVEQQRAQQQQVEQQRAQQQQAEQQRAQQQQAEQQRQAEKKAADDKKKQ